MPGGKVAPARAGRGGQRHRGCRPGSLTLGVRVPGRAAPTCPGGAGAGRRGWEVGGRWACAAGAPRAGPRPGHEAVACGGPSACGHWALSWATSQFPGPRASRGREPPRPAPTARPARPARASSLHRHQRCPGTQPSARAGRHGSKQHAGRSPGLALASRAGGLDRPGRGPFSGGQRGLPGGSRRGALLGARPAHPPASGKVAVSPEPQDAARGRGPSLLPAPLGAPKRGRGRGPVCWGLPAAERSPASGRSVARGSPWACPPTAATPWAGARVLLPQTASRASGPDVGPSS